MLKKRIHFWWA